MCVHFPFPLSNTSKLSATLIDNAEEPPIALSKLLLKLAFVHYNLEHQPFVFSGKASSRRKSIFRKEPIKHVLLLVPQGPLRLQDVFEGHPRQVPRVW